MAIPLSAFNQNSVDQTAMQNCGHCDNVGSERALGPCKFSIIGNTASGSVVRFADEDDGREDAWLIWIALWLVLWNVSSESERIEQIHCVGIRRKRPVTLSAITYTSSQSLAYPMLSIPVSFCL